MQTDLMQKLNSMYASNGVYPISSETLSFDNGFYTAIKSLGKSLFTEAQESSALFKRQGVSCDIPVGLLGIVENNTASKRGEVGKRGVKADDKSVVDICKLVPLVLQGVQGINTVTDEIAYYRACMLDIDTVMGSKGALWVEKARLLFLDYLLATSVCYIEVFKGGTVDKYFATRNIALVAEASGISPAEAMQYSSYLSTTVDSYKVNNLTVIKLVPQKNGSMKITKPRSPLTLNNTIKVTPIPLILNCCTTIQMGLQSSIMKFVYVKDNGQLREMYSTLDARLLGTLYTDGDVVKHYLASAKVVLNRGYMQIPELGISKYDATGCRALNLTRIVEAYIVPDVPTGLKELVSVDLGIVSQEFIKYVEAISTDEALLVHLYSLLYNGSANPAWTREQLKEMILNWEKTNELLGSTTFLRELHKFMRSNPTIFSAYTGKPITSAKPTGSFDIGTTGSLDF